MIYAEIPANVTGWTVIPNLTALRQHYKAEMGKQAGSYTADRLPVKGWRVAFDMREDGIAEFVCERICEDGSVASVCWPIAFIAAFPPNLKKDERRMKEEIKEECPLVWAEEPWWTQRSPDLLAQDAKAGKAGTVVFGPKRVGMCAGRYLAKFFGSALKETEIRSYASWQVQFCAAWATHNSAQPFALATEPDAIVEVYQRGPYSCMQLSYVEKENHPARIYGAGDLAIAYQGTNARALVWPARKIFGRVYPVPDDDGEDEENEDMK